MINNTDCFVVAGWMVEKLLLTGKELIIFAIIYGRTQYPGGWFRENLDYLSEWADTSNEITEEIINSLLRKGLLIVTTDYDEDLNLIKKYKATPDSPHVKTGGR